MLNLIDVSGAWAPEVHLEHARIHDDLRQIHEKSELTKQEMEAAAQVDNPQLFVKLTRQWMELQKSAQPLLKRHQELAIITAFGAEALCSISGGSN